MAFQVGEIKISGTIDELSFYHSVFGWLVRRKGGPTRKQFKNSPTFARSRENSDEFTLCSKAASAIRKLIINHTNKKPETKKQETLYHRLFKLMRLLANADQKSVRGQRDPLKGIHTQEGKLLLKDFEITPELNLYHFLLSINYIEEKVQHEKTTIQTTRSAAIKKRKIRPRVFRLLSKGIIPLLSESNKIQFVCDS